MVTSVGAEVFRLIVVAFGLGFTLDFETFLLLILVRVA
jgi:hypothetical protein